MRKKIRSTNLSLPTYLFIHLSLPLSLLFSSTFTCLPTVVPQTLHYLYFTLLLLLLPDPTLYLTTTYCAFYSTCINCLSFIYSYLSFFYLTFSQQQTSINRVFYSWLLACPNNVSLLSMRCYYV